MIVKFFKGSLEFIFALVLGSILLTVPTLLLWNWLMPELFGLKSITFFQALGVNLLSGGLFRGK